MVDGFQSCRLSMGDGRSGAVSKGASDGNDFNSRMLKWSWHSTNAVTYEETAAAHATGAQVWLQESASKLTTFSDCRE
jgi:hypothetical protein